MNTVFGIIAFSIFFAAIYLYFTKENRKANAEVVIPKE